jgi:hypothetical protein
MSYNAGKQCTGRATLSETASVLIEWAPKEGWNPETLYSADIPEVKTKVSLILFLSLQALN